MVWRFSFAVVLTLSVCVSAQTADDRELAQYKLTADVLTKVEAVSKTFSANVEKDPAIKKRLAAQRELAALEKKDDLTEAEEKRLEALQTAVGDNPVDFSIEGGSLTQMATQLSKIPAMSAALKANGMLPRDMAKFIVVAVQASMLASLQASGNKVPLPPGMSTENVKFAAENQAALERINKILGAGQ